MNALLDLHFQHIGDGVFAHRDDYWVDWHLRKTFEIAVHKHARGKAMSKKKFRYKKSAKPRLTPADRKAIEAANQSGLLCLVNRETRTDPLYTFYDKQTGKVLSESWKEDWIEAINRAIQRKWNGNKMLAML